MTMQNLHLLPGSRLQRSRWYVFFTPISLFVLDSDLSGIMSLLLLADACGCEVKATVLASVN